MCLIQKMNSIVVTEAVVRRYSSKLVSLKISQIAQKNACVSQIIKGDV